MLWENHRRIPMGSAGKQQVASLMLMGLARLLQQWKFNWERMDSLKLFSQRIKRIPFLHLFALLTDSVNHYCLATLSIKAVRPDTKRKTLKSAWMCVQSRPDVPPLWRAAIIKLVEGPGKKINGKSIMQSALDSCDYKTLSDNKEGRENRKTLPPRKQKYAIITKYMIHLLDMWHIQFAGWTCSPKLNFKGHAHSQRLWKIDK